MNIKCSLENESFKYVYGVRNKKFAPDENRKLSLTCARNDRAAVQLLLYSENDMLVCVNGDPSFYEKGPLDVLRVSADIPGIGKGNIDIRLIGLVEDDDRQLKADILLDASAIHVEGGRVQPVWIETAIGKDVRPGLYKPQITVYGHRMFEDEAILRTMEFEINVLELVLEDPREYGFYLDLWQHNSNIARKYDVDLWGVGHFKIIENYIASLANIGQKAISLVVSEIPWSGQYSFLDKIDPANLYEYNIVKVNLDKNGRWSYDFSKLNRYVDLCMKYGINEEIEVFGLMNIWLDEAEGFGRVIKDYDDGVRIRYFDECSQSYKYIQQLNDFESYLCALEDNFIGKGWIGKVRIVADEPQDIERFIERKNIIRNAAPGFKFKVALNSSSFIQKNIEGISDYVIILPSICHDYDEFTQIRDRVEGRLSYYVCCGPDFPNTFICSHLLEARSIPWLAWYLKLDGFLRWNYTIWPNDPIRKITYHYPYFKAGDTNFVYPGKDGNPMLTLRYKSLQKGIRDYEIIRCYAEEIKDLNKIDNLIKKVFLWNDIKELHPDSRKNNTELFSLDYEDYEGVINELMKDIVKNRKN